MPDREKLIKALECTGNECENCPYHVVDSDELGTWGRCDEEKMHSDATALLREQEPVKPLRYEGWAIDCYACGNCAQRLLDTGKLSRPKYCPECGRAVKWRA